MKKIFFFLFAMLVISLHVFSQEQPSLEWAKSTEVGVGLKTGLSVTVDSSSNVYEAGVSYKGGQSGAPLDGFVKKFTAGGTLVWSKDIHGTIARETATAIKYDKRGFLIITGYFQATVDFDPGPGIFNLSGIANESNAFILCLDTDGNFVYAKKIGTTNASSNCVGNALVIDNTANVYVTGTFTGTVDFDSGVAVNTLTSTAGFGAELFVAKYDPFGNYIYAKTLGSPSTNGNTGKSLAIDYNGDVIVAGGINNNRSGYVAKITPGGALLWERYLGSNLYAEVKGIAIDKANNIFITGAFSGSMHVDPLPTTNYLNSNLNTGDIFLLKYNTSGTRQWSFGMGSAGTFNVGDKGNDIFVDNNNDVLICGQTNGIFDIDPGSGTVNIAYAGQDDAYIAKYSNNGAYLWHKLIAGTSAEVAYAIAVDKNGSVFTTGNTQNQELTDFDPDGGQYTLPANTTAPPGGDFIHKMTLLPIPQVMNIPNQCHQATTAKAKLINPLLGAIKTVTVDGTVVTYTAADSSFTYFTGSGTTPVGNHAVRITYANPGGSKIKDTGYVVNPSISPSALITANSTDFCNGQTVSFTATATNGGAPQYQWKVNGINVGTNAALFQTNTLMDNARVQVILTSTAACAFPASVPSNAITVTVRPNVVPGITISGNSILHAGQAALLTTAFQNGGTTPVYQWQDSTSTHSWNNIMGAVQPSYIYTPLSNGDRIRCVLISNAGCASPATVYSNSIRFTLSTEYKMKIYPNPVRDKITIDSLNLSEKWAVAEVIAIDGKKVRPDIDIKGKLKIEIPITILPAGVYILILRKEDGTKAITKFVRQ
jgi:Secretion system C-terminal sorting domain/Beta-propeller repeat